MHVCVRRLLTALAAKIAVVLYSNQALYSSSFMEPAGTYRFTGRHDDCQPRPLQVESYSYIWPRVTRLPCSLQGKPWHAWCCTDRTLQLITDHHCGQVCGLDPLLPPLLGTMVNISYDAAMRLRTPLRCLNGGCL